MLNGILERLSDKKMRNLALAAGGMLALMGGRRIVALGLFGAGMAGLEQNWREEHPEFQGTWSDRWRVAEEFYEETHQDDTNRMLHVVGIPIIIGGTAGLLAFRPYRPLWAASLGAFSLGWAMNLVGHGVFEKAAPAFADDPLSFLAGPVWDLKQIQARWRGVSEIDERANGSFPSDHPSPD